MHSPETTHFRGKNFVSSEYFSFVLALLAVLYLCVALGHVWYRQAGSFEVGSGLVFFPPLDFVWFPLIALSTCLSWCVRRTWLHPTYAIALTALVLMAWACLGATPFGATPFPKWLAPRGLTVTREIALTLLLLGWIALELRSSSLPLRRPWQDAALVGGFTVARILPLTMSVELDWFIQEEGLFLANGLALLDGEHMYSDRWEFLWPGIFLFSSFLLWLFDRMLLGVRLVLTLVYALCSLLIYSCVRRQAGRGAALVGVLLFLTALAPHPVHWDPHWLTTCTGLIATWCLARDFAPSRPLALGAGLAIGTTVLLQQHKGFGLLICLGGAFMLLTGYTALSEGRAAAGPYLRSFPWIGLGIGAVIGPVLLRILLRGDWAAFHYATWTWLFEGYGPANTSPARLLPAEYVLEGPWWALLANLWWWGSESVAYFSAFALVIAPLIWVLPPPRGCSRRAWWILTAGCMGVFSATLLRFQYLRLVYASPATCLLLAAGIGRLWSYRIAGKGWARLAQAGTLVLITTMAVHTWKAQLSYQSLRPRWGVARTEVGPLLLTAFDQQRLRDTVESAHFLSQLPADAECYAYPLSGGYVLLTGRRNPTRFHFILPGYSRPWQVEEVVATLESRRVRYVLWDRNYSERFLKDVYPKLRVDAFDNNRITAYIMEHYRPIAEWPTISIFERAT